MPQANSTVAHAVLDELVAVDIPDAAAGAVGDEAGCAHGILVVTLGVGMTSARDERVRLLLQSF